MYSADAIIIGSGQGGVPLAAELADKKMKVVLFEKSRFGGSCVNWGCTPSKAFLGSAHAAGRARAAGRLGLSVNISIDFSTVMNRVRDIRNNFSEGVENSLRKSGVEIVETEASFDDHGNVRGGGETYSSPLVVIDTGSRPMIPPVAGIENVGILTDRNFWELEDLPRQALVIGGGYIGLELGQGLARLGSTVEIVEMKDRIMGGSDPSVSEVLQEALEADGIRFHLGISVDSVERRGEAVLLHTGEGRVLEGDVLLVAAGRKPETDSLNAGAAGIELDEKGFIRVDEQLQTTRPGVYAMGEAAGQPAFTHVAWEDYRRIAAAISGSTRKRNDRVLAYAVFTEPQVAVAGITADQARQKGIKARSVRMEVKNMARAIEWGHEFGFYEMVIDEATGKIIGATLVGYEAAEIVHVFLDLIEAGADWRVLERAQHIHPTYAENLPSLARMFIEQ